MVFYFNVLISTSNSNFHSLFKHSYFTLLKSRNTSSKSYSNLIRISIAGNETFFFEFMQNMSVKIHLSENMKNSMGLYELQDFS